MTDDYLKAKRAGERAVRQAEAEGVSPYPPALDEILEGKETAGEMPVGLREIPLDLIVGTKTVGRQNAFARNFMPILDEDSEFAAKWTALYDSQIEEGIREPILVYEYLSRFYVQEGNKRVSVMRCVGTATARADVVRILPERAPENDWYYEFLDFYRVCPVYGILFSDRGGYARLASAMGKTLSENWSEEDVESLRMAFHTFENLCGSGFAGEPEKTGDALLVYLDVYPVKTLLTEDTDTLKSRMSLIKKEIKTGTSEDAIALVKRPEDEPKQTTGIFGVLKSPSYSAQRPLRVSFLFDSHPVKSGWIYGHELGRQHIEEAFGGVVKTEAVTDCGSGRHLQKQLATAAAGGADVIITTSPSQMTETRKAAIEYPKVHFLNCSVNLPVNAVRCYYGRMYEAKFLMGVLAASVATGHKIGYLADYPIYGTVANINAFAVGASLVDPLAKVYLRWASEKDKDWKTKMRHDGITVFSGADMIKPEDASREYGLFRYTDDDRVVNLAAPMTDWGKYYELMIEGILEGEWKKNRQDVSLNYWYGMESGVIDCVLSDHLPYPSRKLVQILKKAVAAGTLDPFDGELRSQDGLIQPEGSPCLASEDVITMNWLNDNVVGTIPAVEDMTDRAKRAVSVSGVSETAKQEATAAVTAQVAKKKGAEAIQEGIVTPMSGVGDTE